MEYLNDIGKQAKWMFGPLAGAVSALRHIGLARRLKWIVIFSATIFPVLAYGAWLMGSNLQTINQNGVETVAKINNFRIETAESRKNKRDKRYFVDLTWKDSQGMQHSANKINLSKWTGETLHAKNGIAATGLKIKYLPGKRKPKLFVVSDYNMRLSKSKRNFKKYATISMIAIFLSLGMLMYKERYQ